MTQVLEIVKAVAVGMLSNVVRKLGPSIILFTYIWALHSKAFTRLGPTLWGLPPKFWLALAAILLGVASLAFKDTVGNFAKRMDRRAMPRLQYQVLRHLNHLDLTFQNIQRLALEILTGLKSGVIFLTLILIACFAFPIFAGVLIVVVAAVVGLSWNAARYPQVNPDKSFLMKLQTHPEYYAEVLVIAGLILAFATIASEKSFVSGTVFILIVSRFSNEIKVVARVLVAVRRSHIHIVNTWATRDAAQAKRMARQAENEARTRARQAEQRARQEAAQRKAKPAPKPAPDQSADTTPSTAA